MVIARLAVSLLLTACLLFVGQMAGGVAAEAEGAAAEDAPTAVPPPPPVVPLERLSPAAARLLAEAGGETSAAIFRSGWAAIYAYGLDRSLMLASVSKVLLSLQVLDEARRQGRTIDEWEAESIDLMLRYSDNWSTEWVWWQLGMSAGHQAWLDAKGLTGLTAAWNDDWGDTAGNARNTGLVFARLLAGHLTPAPDRDYLVDLMAGVTAEQRWGAIGVLDERFPGRVTGGKNGWWPNDDGWWVNSVGFVTRPDYGDWGVVVVLMRGQDDFEAAIATIEAVTRELAGFLGA